MLFSDCYTSGGADPNAKCLFPFNFRGETFYECTFVGSWENETDPWCSTKVDWFDNHVGGEGNWGYCAENSGCPLPGKHLYSCIMKNVKLKNK